MAAKYPGMTIYPDPKLRKKIEEQAKKENRHNGPMVLEIVRQFFVAKDQPQG